MMSLLLNDFPSVGKIIREQINCQINFMYLDHYSQEIHELIFMDFL